MNFNLLNKLVNESKLGKSRIAEIAKISRTTLDNALSGADIKISTLESLAKVLGVSTSVFFCDNESINEEKLNAPTISQTVTASSHVTQTACAPAETPAAANALLAAKDETIAANALLAAKDETIAALRQSLADKERLICTLLEARSTKNP